MENLREIHARRVMQKLSVRTVDIAAAMQNVMDSYINGNIRAARAKREYYQLIQPVPIYCKIALRLAKKYHIDNYVEFADFQKYITFFCA